MQTICLVIQIGTQFRANRLQTDAKPDPEFQTRSVLVNHYDCCVSSLQHYWCISTSFRFRVGLLEFNDCPEEESPAASPSAAAVVEAAA